MAGGLFGKAKDAMKKRHEAMDQAGAPPKQKPKPKPKPKPKKK